MVDNSHSFNDKVCCSGGKEKVWKFNQISFFDKFEWILCVIFRCISGQKKKKTEEVVKIEGSPCRFVTVTDDLLKTFLEKEEMKSDELTDIKDFCVILRIDDFECFFWYKVYRVSLR